MLGYSRGVLEQKGLSSLSGGNQVDGLPPASSTDAGPVGPRAITELFTKIGRKIEVFLKNQPIRPGSQNFCMSGMSMGRRMQSGGALYSLWATAAMRIGWHLEGQKCDFFLFFFLMFSLIIRCCSKRKRKK